MVDTGARESEEARVSDFTSRDDLDGHFCCSRKAEFDGKAT